MHVLGDNGNAMPTVRDISVMRHLRSVPDVLHVYLLFLDDIVVRAAQLLSWYAIAQAVTITTTREMRISVNS